jgi:hypothetical protein
MCVELVATLFERTPLGGTPVDSTSAGCGNLEQTVLQTFHPDGVRVVVAVHSTNAPTGAPLVFLPRKTHLKVSTKRRPSKYEEHELPITELRVGQSDIAAP